MYLQNVWVIHDIDKREGERQRQRQRESNNAIIINNSGLNIANITAKLKTIVEFILYYLNT